MTDPPWGLLLGAPALTLTLTAVLRAWLLSRRYLDLPNHRSSHSAPVPRGGGIAFVTVVCAGIICLATRMDLPSFASYAALGILVVALVGFWDDICGVGAGVRLACHIGCGALAVFGPAQILGSPILHGPLEQSLLLASLTLVAAWTVNMFNFMDGIDGLAAMEGAFVLVAAGVLGIMHPHVLSTDTSIPWAMTASGGAVAGFLAVNLSPWRIFMGDAGSGALGLLVAWWLLLAVVTGWLSSWSAIALLSAFSADACSTLAVRVLNGCSPTQAHRTHVYQLMVRRWGSHRFVTGIYATVNFGVVLPIAWLIQSELAPGPVTALTLQAVLATIALLLGAGREPVAPKSVQPSRDSASK